MFFSPRLAVHAAGKVASALSGAVGATAINSVELSVIVGIPQTNNDTLPRNSTLSAEDRPKFPTSLNLGKNYNKTGWNRRDFTVNVSVHT